MATQKTIAEIIQIAKISVTIAANKAGNDATFHGKSPDKTIHKDIYCELAALEYLNTHYPSEEFTRAVANYVYDLCWPYNRQAEVIIDNLGGQRPTVTGPSSDTVSDGESVSFSITVVSSTAYTVQWYRDGALISGATSNTYSFTASTDDDGATFFAIVTNPAGSTTSATGTLTVTTSLLGSYYIGDTDYFSALDGGTDAITYNGTFDITDGQPLEVTISDPSSTLGNNKYHVYKYPTSQSLKVEWYNTALNNGTINDSVFRQIVTVGSYYYIISRVQISVDTGSTMVFT
jgi:hypothetical protein